MSYRTTYETEQEEETGMGTGMGTENPVWDWVDLGEGVLLDTPAVIRARGRRKGKSGERYIPPVNLDLLSRLARIPGPALLVGLILIREAAVTGSKDGLRVPTAAAGELGLDRRSVRRGIVGLETAGLVTVDRRSGRPNALTLAGALRGVQETRLRLVQ